MDPNGPSPERTVAVGLSGGVDSTMAALLLQRQGCRVIGVTMQIWDASIPLPDEQRSGCFGPGEARDIAAAQAAAQRLGIPHQVIPLVDEYRRHVLDYFRREYRAGRTPNPCVMCNRAIKFGFLIEKARQSGMAFDCFATGHYARIAHDPASGRRLLRRAVDHAKDQSYFLCRLPQETLAQVLFPLGDLMKEQVKALAREVDWPELAAKQESQDFIESKNYSVLFNEQDTRPGPILDQQGRVVGEHKGLVNYTIGQRKGLGPGGTGEPLYVIRIDAGANAIVIGGRHELLARHFGATDINWIAFAEPPSAPFRAQVKIRQQHKAAPARVTAAGTTARVEFDEPQMSITPGQTVVFYDDDLVLGGGVINSR
jgi:tRNA-specific 2-thiouridylase